MTASELLRFQLDDGTFQLKACIEPLTDSQMDFRATTAAMSAREILEHLCECYEAFLAHAEDRPFEWGNYAVPDKSKDGLSATLFQTRDRAIDAAVKGDDKVLKNAHAYLVAHDCYHVGQLCLAHLSTNPDFDPYSIYDLG